MKDILCEVLILKRTESLQSPSAIYEFLWSTFCVGLQPLDQQIDPLAFIITNTSIEIISLKKFVKHGLFRYFFNTLIGKRVKNDKSVEGIATCIEMLVTELPVAEVYQSIDEFLHINPDAKSIVTLSLEWYGISKIFTRSARKVKNGGKYSFIEIESSNKVEGIFDRFFDLNISEILAERNLQ
jgi:hypothetical protein